MRKAIILALALFFLVSDFYAGFPDIERYVYKGVKVWNNFVKKNSPFPANTRLDFLKIINMNLNGVNFSRLRLYRAKIKNSSLKRGVFVYTKFSGNYLTNVDFSYSNMSAASMTVRAKKACFYKVNFTKAELEIGSTFIDCNFNEADMRYSKISAKEIRNCTFKETVFIGAVMSLKSLKYNTKYYNCNFAGCDFRGAAFSGAAFKGCDFRGAKIESKWYNYIKRQGVINFDKIVWVTPAR